MLTSTSAGSVTAAASTATSITARAGTRLADSRDQCREPGTARSRLNAYVIRDAEVMQETAQKSCPAEEMNRTVPAQLEPRAALKIGWTPLAPRELSGLPSGRFGTAKTTASSRM